ncbi:GntR family transcriptional regulator [Pseudomonas aeruginosa]|uniref:GntR family transcriptional regulator n=1 Tax=Pseudomonas aeruginosa TaxID=287 RepID=UPI0010682DDC|nr:GntR family transcriptional regulator [Pseudomonas aeruginosa]TED73941.1 GntR family transcriptional regulator [Pseudomonas aeruginosa]TED93047.1 GntR family transcriptional regulator [Pseudomonas aeruginosa]
MNTTVLNIPKVQKRSTEAKAADLLRDAIISGAIPLGTRLTEISSSEQLGVSRGTIRVAFHQLVQEGLLIQTPYTGWSVMTLSPEDAWELYTLRGSLEALASRLVTMRVQQEGATGFTFTSISRAVKALQNACQDGDNRSIANADMALHKTIIDLTNHSRLIEQYTRIQPQIALYIQSSDALVSEGSEIISQHQPLIDAIEAKDVQAAMSSAMHHNETEGAILVDHLKRLSNTTS